MYLRIHWQLLFDLVFFSLLLFWTTVSSASEGKASAFEHILHHLFHHIWWFDRFSVEVVTCNTVEVLTELWVPIQLLSINVEYHFEHVKVFVFDYFYDDCYEIEKWRVNDDVLSKTLVLSVPFDYHQRLVQALLVSFVSNNDLEAEASDEHIILWHVRLLHQLIQSQHCLLNISRSQRKWLCEIEKRSSNLSSKFIVFTQSFFHNSC